MVLLLTGSPPLFLRCTKSTCTTLLHSKEAKTQAPRLPNHVHDQVITNDILGLAAKHVACLFVGPR